MTCRTRRTFFARLVWALLLFAAIAGRFPGTLVKASEATPLVAEKPSPAAGLNRNTPTSLAALRDVERKLIAARDRMIASTVCVRAGNAFGSGVVVNEEGYILTAEHVVGRTGMPAQIYFADGSTAMAETLGVDKERDAGILKLTEEVEFQFSPMATADDYKLGDWCVATGHPGGFRLGRPPTVRLGRVIEVKDSFIRSDCTLVGGDSGGPLFSLDGKVIGINSRIGPATSLNYHVPVAIYSSDWEGLTKLAFLGVKGSGDPRLEECLLTEVPEKDNYPAFHAGLRAGDIVKKIDDTDISNFNDLTATVIKYRPGNKIKVTVERDGKTLQFDVTLAIRPIGD